MPQHTPGPWIVLGEKDEANGFPCIGVGNERQAVCEVLPSPNPYGGYIVAAEDQANAHLIAAAPELLTQLQGLLAATKLVISAVGIDPDQTNVDFRANGQPIANVRIADLLANADAAVAKAEGR